MLRSVEAKITPLEDPRLLMDKVHPGKLTSSRSNSTVLIKLKVFKISQEPYSHFSRRKVNSLGATFV